LLLALNRIQRSRSAGALAGDIDADDIVRQYRAARAELRYLVPLLVLSGPDELAEAANAVIAADRDLRAQRFAVDPDPSKFDEDVYPAAIQKAEKRLQDEVMVFARRARKFVR
jgi:hypothetical protein